MKKKSKLSALTIRRLRIVRTTILLNAPLYDQAEPGSIRSKHTKDHPCRTPACILGWANRLFPEPSRAMEASAKERAIDAYNYRSGKLSEYGTAYTASGRRAFYLAMARLRLTAEQALLLWHRDNWPVKYQPSDWSVEDDLEVARKAAKRITHFIRTNGRE